MSEPKTLMASIPLPPFAVYYLAHEPKPGPKKRDYDLKKRLSYRQMAARGGMTERSFMRLTGKLTWEGVPIDVADKFFRACGIEIFRFSKHRNYLVQALKNGYAYHFLPKRQANRFRDLCIRAKALKLTGN